MAAKLHDDPAPITRLYERLTEALQRTRRDPFNVPVTVAEIYQELVPYRLVRTEIGFDMNADYEHALLRLLAGEGEWVRIEPAHAADEIRRELRSSNPNLSIYRDYAACDVWVRKPLAAAEPRRSDRAAPPPPAVPSRPARPAAEPSLAGRVSASHAAPGQKAAPAEPAPAKQAQAARSTAEPSVAEKKEKTRPRVEPPESAHEQTKKSAPAADWLTPIELQDILLTGEAPEAGRLEKFTLAGDDRPDEHEDNQDDERSAAVTPMSEKPKREAAPAGEAARSSPAAKSGKSPNPPRSAAVPAAASSPGSGPAAQARSAKPGAHAAKPEAARCAFCDSPLPQQRPARFCPYCGADQTTRPCASCGEPLDPGWAFCITCGATAQ